jgi:hypothetical protein
MNIGFEKNFYDLMIDNQMYGYHIYFLMLDGKVIYVGQTKNIFGRIAEYKCRFLKHTCHNQKLQELFDSGEIKRVVFLVKDKTESQRGSNKLEKFYIKEHRDTCLNKYDDFFSQHTRKQISTASKKMWLDEKLREQITKKVSKKHILISPSGTKFEFDNSYDVKKYLEKINEGLHRNDRKRIGYQMLESFGENKGWRMTISGKRTTNTKLSGILKTPSGESISINGKWELINVNRDRGFKINVTKIVKNGECNGFVFNKN